jgi:tetratricopeptide (TPR) repeat protein
VEEESASAVRYFTIANGELEGRIAGRRAELEEGNRLVQGISPEDGSDTILYYPAEGLAILTRMEDELAADRAAAETLLARYAGEPPENLGGDVLQGLYTAAVSMAAELGALNLREQGLAADARTRIAQADAYGLDGDRLFLESQNALGRSNFEVARDRIQRAAERYGASLAIQENAGRRAAWDARILSLGNEIDRIENEIIVRDVRNLVNNARTAYFAGNFEQAEELLVRAQNRWRITNVEDDPEVAYWLNMVRGALSLRSGRVISPTAPLYAEMSQLLSEAKTNYDEGVRLLNMSRRTEGLAKFTEARQKTREVRLMFPVNKEAGILELRMDQVTDREAFDRSFEQRFREAVAGTRPNVRSAEAFADLQNLAEINSRYPGMAAAVTQAEIDMGFRPPPPDPRDLARSRELTAAARVIVEGNITVQFDVALAQLNQAIQLDPNNTQATSIKDQLQTRMGGASGSLDTASEAEYQRAVQEYQQGRLLVALSIVRQLLQNPRNRNSVRILELERRIQSVL